MAGACEGGAIVVGAVEGWSALPASRGSPSVLAPPSRGCDDRVARRVSSASCWPTGHVGRWLGAVTSDAQYFDDGGLLRPFPAVSFSLRLHVEGRGELEFAARPWGVGGCADAGSDAGSGGCSPIEPGPLLAGYSYELFGLEASGGAVNRRTQDPRLSFSLLPGEPVRGDCAAPARELVASSADAGADVCRVVCDLECVATRALLGFSLELSARGGAMRGTVTSQGPAGASALGRVELVRQ